MSLNALATRTVQRYAADDLLPMLGLVAEDGTVTPDDTTWYVLSEPSTGPGAHNPKSPLVTSHHRTKPMTTPPGLANLPPVVEEPVVKKRRGPRPQPKVTRPRKERVVPECGQYKAYARHRRLGEPIDDACREAAREYGKNMNSDYRLRLRKTKELKRLLAEGVSSEAAATLVELVR